MFEPMNLKSRAEILMYSRRLDWEEVIQMDY
jgi:hypothetical protein